MDILYLNQYGLTQVDDSVPIPDGNRIVYKSMNPRTYDAARAIPGIYDRRSTVGSVPLTQTYTDPTLKNFVAKAHYASGVLPREQGESMNKRYAIDNSQIQYYVDKSIQAPFSQPTFDTTQRGIVRFEDYVDPMGSTKPHYYLTLTCPTENTCLSFLADTNFHRADIIARQMAVRNQQRSEPFFRT